MEEGKITLKWPMIRRDVLRHWPIWALSFIIYLFVVCLVNAVSRNFISTVTRQELSMIIAESLIETTKFLGFLMGPAAAWASFGFLVNKKKDYFFEALPFNRFSLYINKFIFGFITCMLPCVTMFFIELIQLLIMSGKPEIGMLLKWIASAFIEYLFWYSLAVLFMVLCGRIIMAGFCYLMFSFAGLFMSFFIEICNMICFVGVNSGFGGGDSILGILSPVEYIFQIEVDYRFGYDADTQEIYNIFVEGSTEKLIVTLISAIVLMVLSYILYRKRSEERTGDSFVFKGMKAVFSCILSFIGTVTLSVIIFSMIFYQNDEIAHRAGDRVKLIAIMFIIGFIEYLISCMLVERKLKVFKAHYCLKALIFTVCVSLIGTAYLHDLFNIEGYVPDTGEVRFINVSRNNEFIEDMFTTGRSGVVTMSDKAAIEKIRKMHLAIVEHIEEAGETYQPSDHCDYYIFSFSYKLKNDSTVSRNYRIYDGSILSKEIERIKIES